MLTSIQPARKRACIQATLPLSRVHPGEIDTNPITKEELATHLKRFVHSWAKTKVSSTSSGQTFSGKKASDHRRLLRSFSICTAISFTAWNRNPPPPPLRSRREAPPTTRAFARNQRCLETGSGALATTRSGRESRSWVTTDAVVSLISLTDGNHRSILYLALTVGHFWLLLLVPLKKNTSQ